jgi:hypothetical protein
MTRLSWALLIIAATGGLSRAEEVLPPHPPQVNFRRDVYPLLQTRCFRCHEGRDAKSGVRLDVRDELLGHNGEPLVKPGDSAGSRLFQLVARIDPDEVMPPAEEAAPLNRDEVAVLRAWIDQGLAWDERLLPLTAGADHWAFRPIVRPHVPSETSRDTPVAVAGGRRPECACYLGSDPIDSFIAAEQAKRGLTPAREASRRTLIRRLSLDLTGLPPAPEEVAAFLADDSPDAYERLVDRLLASLAYGERWGRHWLDLARFAESEGYESNHLRPFAWRYRDYVIGAFNADKPYDEFLRQQIAGDEMQPYTDENLIATGFLAAARLSSNEEDKKLQNNAVLVDIVNATGSTVLGLTFGCAQCHDHKFDPLSQRDYYSWQAFFVRGAPNNLTLKNPTLWAEFNAAKPVEYESALSLRAALEAKTRRALEAKTRAELSPETLAALDTPDHERTAEQLELVRQADLLIQFTPSQIEKAGAEEDRPLWDALKKRIAEMENSLPGRPQTWGFYSPASGAAGVEVLPMVGFYPPPYEPEKLREARAYVLNRGEVHERGEEAPPAWPRVLGAQNEKDRNAIEQRPRSALVDWLTDRENPLTARVWVNRIWAHHFGRGIVETMNDFGLRGAAPTHPELLDWLACELIESGWSTKHIQRLIVMSATYRQRAVADFGLRIAEAEEVIPHSAFHIPHSIDPENHYLWRFPIRRLEAEAIRDSVLFVSGELDATAGGPSGKEDEAETSRRRSLYQLQKRDAFPAMHRLFDGAAANESCAAREISTTALQPLYLLNSEFMVRQAQSLAERVERAAGPGGQIAAAFEIVLGRLPDEEEQKSAIAFFATSEAESSGEALSPLAQFCHALLNLNEFVYLE